MSSLDDKLIYEVYSQKLLEGPVPAPAPTGTGSISDYPPGTQINWGGQTFVIPQHWIPNSTATEIPLHYSDGRAAGQQQVATIDAEIAAGRITATPPQQDEPSTNEQSPEQQQSQQLSNTAGWARGVGAALGTDPASTHVGGGLQKGVGGADWLTRGAINLAGKGVQALGQKAPERDDAAVAYRNNAKRSA